MKAGPAEKLDKKNADQRAKAVETYVLDAGSPAGNKGLMIFVKSGEAYADDPRQHKEPEASDPVYIQRKRNGDGKETVFCHMGGFPHIVVDRFRFICQFVITFSGI